MLYVFTMFPCVSDVTSLLMPPQWYSSLRSPHHPPHFIIIHDPKYGNRFALGLEISLGDRLLKIFGIKNKKNCSEKFLRFRVSFDLLVTKFYGKICKSEKVMALSPPSSPIQWHVTLHWHTLTHWIFFVCVCVCEKNTKNIPSYCVHWHIKTSDNPARMHIKLLSDSADSRQRMFGIDPDIIQSMRVGE